MAANYPYRPTGWFYVLRADGHCSRCTAALISRSILLTAGHCVNAGRVGSAGWIRAGWFYPSWTNGAQPYGYATAAGYVTTNGWFNVGAIDQGYDVGLVVLNKRAGTTYEMGAYTSWYGFCASGCLQRYWHLSQLGYPANYYGGQYMTQGEHLETSDGRDMIFGSGMQGGSSGGPHVANLGSLSGTSANKGQWPWRNIAFAATSWGYVSDIYKIQGASTTSGPGNSNNFVGMWNLACNYAKSLHGAASCTNL